MTGLAEGILRNAKRQLREQVGQRGWFRRALLFDGGHYLDDENGKYATQLFGELDLAKGYKIDKKRRTFDSLLANLFQTWPRPLAISRNRNWWSRPEVNGIGYEITKYINLLNERGYIDMKDGYYFDDKAALGKVWPTEKLLDYFPQKSPGVKWRPVNLIELRDPDSKELMRYDETEQTARIQRILKQANKVNRDAEIWHGNNGQIRAFLIAIFVGDFALYGRLHTKGYRHYQGMDEGERAQITINGDPVIELDYRALNPYLLYAEEGKQYMGDPYTVVHDNPVARPFLKQILLSMLNSDSDQQAEAAANYWLYKNHGHRRKLKKIGITRARPLMEAYKEAHRPISSYFCSGKETGLKVMNKDAGIALDVVEWFTDKGIPILAVHDSFVVQQRYHDTLDKIMKKMYTKHTGGFRCKVHQ